MSVDAYAVILAGGKGERFWPLSTSKHPKQFLSLVGDKPLLAQAVDRLNGLVPPEKIFVITNADLVDTASASAPALPKENIIGEPVGRDTAAAIALGAALVARRNPDGVFAVLTADHIIGDIEVYAQTLRDSFTLAAREEVLLTIGIKPAFPSTGYGYIEAGDLREKSAAGTVFRQARRFVEKPDLTHAQQYLGEGHYFWNSGMFIWSARAIEHAFAAYRPPLSEMINALREAPDEDAFTRAFHAAFASLEKISIDYAVMEKADNVVMAEGTFAWDDVGAWPALRNHFPADGAGNVLIGQAMQLDCADTTVVSHNRLTTLIGVRDLIVVQADGATLICPRDRAQDIKQLVHEMQQTPYKDLL
ncbi:MAG: mannose-1-phosphate guanyltransferase [Spartobacteria bacterium]|nr:mannose-1-phosphate guanyltransferase [Spartobacteria bacterium]